MQVLLKRQTVGMQVADVGPSKETSKWMLVGYRSRRWPTLATRVCCRSIDDCRRAEIVEKLVAWVVGGSGSAMEGKDGLG